MTDNETKMLALLIKRMTKLSDSGKRDLLLIAQGIEIGENVRNGGGGSAETVSNAG